MLHTDPVKLVGILYRAAIESVAAAREHVRRGEIRERSRRITKAWEIVRELQHSLDHAHGGEISRNLMNLYIYIQERLIQANLQQVEAPLSEAESLLTTLQEAWAAASPQAQEERVDSEEYVPLSCTY